MFNDLNKHLMWQLDRLSSIKDEDLKDSIESEAKRANAIVTVAKEMVSISNTVIEAHKLALEYNVNPSKVLGVGHEED